MTATAMMMRVCRTALDLVKRACSCGLEWNRRWSALTSRPRQPTGKPSLVVRWSSWGAVSRRAGLTARPGSCTTTTNNTKQARQMVTPHNDIAASWTSPLFSSLVGIFGSFIFAEDCSRSSSIFLFLTTFLVFFRFRRFLTFFLIPDMPNEG